MSKIKKNFALALWTLAMIIVIAMLVPQLMFSGRWPRVYNASVIKNGIVSTHSQVYRSANGKILLLLLDESGTEEVSYVIDPIRKKVYLGGRFNFLVLSNLAYDKKRDYGVDMDSSKVDVKPHLRISRSEFSFNSYQGKRITLRID